jgi:hemerythrin superfamily protein
MIYDELKKDHDQVKEMMTRIVEMSSRSSTSKVKLFEEMKAALTAHVRAEEKVFYDAIKRERSAHDSALEGYEEHHVADLLMREISRLAPSDEKRSSPSSRRTSSTMSRRRKAKSGIRRVRF